MVKEINRIYNWQQKGWPRVAVNRAVLRDELRAFTAAFKDLKKVLRAPQDMEIIARALTDEAVKTSAIEGVKVDESVVMSSICRALGIATPPMGFAKDARAEGVANMMLLVRKKRYRLNTPICEPIEPLNEPLNEQLFKLIKRHSGAQLQFLKSFVGVSTATIKRAVAALVADGKIEHRGSKKTGGYWIKEK